MTSIAIRIRIQEKYLLQILTGLEIRDISKPATLQNIVRYAIMAGINTLLPTETNYPITKDSINHLNSLLQSRSTSTIKELVKKKVSTFYYPLSLLSNLDSTEFEQAKNLLQTLNEVKEITICSNLKIGGKVGDLTYKIFKSYPHLTEKEKVELEKYATKL